MKRNKPAFILLFLALFGCSDLGNQPASETTLPRYKDYVIVVIDSCEYIKTHGYDVHYEHKGNCSFCKMQREKELEELAGKLKDE